LDRQGVALVRWSLPSDALAFGSLRNFIRMSSWFLGMFGQRTYFIDSAFQSVEAPQPGFNCADGK